MTRETATLKLTADDLAEARRIASTEPQVAAAAAKATSGNGAGPTSTSTVEVDRYTGRVLDVAALLAEPDEPIPWRCDRLAADGYLTVLAGRGGEGKSWMALALACGVARGRRVAGIECRQGKALIFDAENGPKLIARRLRAAQVGPDLEVQPVDAGGLKISTDIDWFRQTIRDQHADLVVFDSLRVLSTGAKESDSDEMEPLVTALKQLARDTGAAIVLIHHRGKSDANHYRGSSVILDQTDMMFTLGRIEGDPDGRHRRKVDAVKCRIDEEPVPRWVKIVADRALGLVTVDAAEPYEGTDGPATPARDALRADVLDALTVTKRPQASIARDLGRDPRDATVRRLLRDLADEGLAVHDDEGWGVSRLTPQGNDTLTPLPANGSVEPKVGGVKGGVKGVSPDTVNGWSPEAEQAFADRVLEFPGAYEVTAGGAS